MFKPIEAKRYFKRILFTWVEALSLFALAGCAIPAVNTVVEDVQIMERCQRVDATMLTVDTIIDSHGTLVYTDYIMPTHSVLLPLQAGQKYIIRLSSDTAVLFGMTTADITGDPLRASEALDVFGIQEEFRGASCQDRHIKILTPTKNSFMLLSPDSKKMDSPVVFVELFEMNDSDYERILQDIGEFRKSDE